MLWTLCPALLAFDLPDMELPLAEREPSLATAMAPAPDGKAEEAKPLRF